MITFSLRARTKQLKHTLIWRFDGKEGKELDDLLSARKRHAKGSHDFCNAYRRGPGDTNSAMD